ncbi:MAG: hypothetical protein ACYDDF_03640 [Thermoplasmatota archaeon]
MDQVVLTLHYADGSLPVRGYRCPVCSAEMILGPDARTARLTAERLGLLGGSPKETRKLLRSGNSLAVSLDRGMIKEILGEAKPGLTVSVHKQGDRIVIEKA